MLSILVLVFVYVSLSSIMQKKIFELESDKGTIIAATLEPTIALNHYLGLSEENVKIAGQVLENPLVTGIGYRISDESSFFGVRASSETALKIDYPVRDPLTRENSGELTLYYSKTSYFKAIDEAEKALITVIAALAVIMVVFNLMIRYLLRPLTNIAGKMSHYTPGAQIDFSDIRTEHETQAIINAFYGMLRKIREHTRLLEQYRHAVDVSAIVSKTDLAGMITYVNDEFVRISGYAKEELLGTGHNVLRHPDMSPKVFEKMWTTILNKQVWQGTIKNRAKDGSAYYVKASIIPILDDEDRILEFIAIRQDITQIIKQQERIARQTKDMITGLPNRVKLMEDIQNYKVPKFAVVELDNFSVINDYYGYEIGNQTLMETAKALRKIMERDDIRLYKLGSGEFGVLMGDKVDVDFFFEMCQGILKTIDDLVVHIGDNSFNVQATAGLSVEPNNVITNAHLALRHARETKKKSLVFEKTENLIEYYENNLKWTKELKSAIREKRIVTFAQPIVKLDTKRVEKYECLVRLIDGEGKVVSPFFFLDVAKQTKLYNRLTQIVIEQSFAHFAQTDVEFSVNISVEDIADPETVAFIKKKIVEYGVGDKLVFELVESEGIENFNEVSNFITEMKTLGCKIAIDDFGTGYSNFGYLMQLKADYIKVDGSLIKNIHADVNSQLISQTLLDFAAKMNVQTIAEFVHNDDVLQKVDLLGFDYVQGYHLGAPKPLSEL